MRSRAADADGSQCSQCVNTGLERRWVLYPVPGSSHHEVLCQCREVPGRAVGGNSSSVLREQPPLQVLGADGGQPAVP